MAFNREWGNYIPNGTINEVIKNWQTKQPERVQGCASPSSLMDCPRVVWLRKQGVEPTNVIGWGKKQRFMLGRITENLIADQLKDEGLLLHHWPDNFEGESKKLTMGVGEDRLEGTPDLLLDLCKDVVISDSKTSRSDSFNYVPIKENEIWADPYWFRHKLQLTAYFMLCHANKDWFQPKDDDLNLLKNPKPGQVVEIGKRQLPLPRACHLFSYALDDGIVRREIVWEPTEVDKESVIRLTRRWNQAYASKGAPACTCVAEGAVKFCPYSIMKEGERVGSSCCHNNLISNKEIT